MLSVTTVEAAPLTMSGIAYNHKDGRWRTEALRGHDSPRLIHITKGQGRITVAGLTSGYGPNNLIYIPAGVMYGFDVAPSVAGQILSIPPDLAGEWPDMPVQLRFRDVRLQHEATALLDGLEREIKASPDGQSRAVMLHLGILAIFVERQIANQDNNTNSLRARTSAARLVAAYTRLVERDYTAQKGVADYAAELGVTPTHLTRCCNQTCGKSALAILRDRIHFQARLMLRESKMPIRDIAAALGFRSAAYFTRSFQAVSGQTPSNFRRFGANRTR